MFRRRRSGAHTRGSDRGGTDQPAVAGEPGQADDLTEPAAGSPGEPAGAEDADIPARGLVDLGDPETWSRSRRAAAPAAGGTGRDSGPWDGAGSFPGGERIDFGSLLVPARDGFDIQVSMAEEQGVWIAVVRGESGLQLQAFAAPKTSGLWDEVRQEIAEEIAQSGGDSQEVVGPFGPELHARVNAAAEGERRPQLQPVRFLGVDGPRWFLRGVVSGPAARRDDLGRPFEEIFADVVVVRGDHPAPPRDLLEIQLPEQARQALEAQLPESELDGLANPFDRGPEITETR